MRREVKRGAILELYNRGMEAKEIVKRLSVTKWCVYRTIKRFSETGSLKDRRRCGRPRSHFRG